MIHVIQDKNINQLYIKLLKTLLDEGAPVSPRGSATVEIRPMLLILEDAMSNVITLPARKLNYSFMVAEWWWMLAGCDDVASISFYNKNIARFSDDGVSFYGAYGPRWREQLDYVISKLKTDRDTRQAVITTWRPSPPVTKDVPCTISMQYMIRDDGLEATVCMRSSDAWLGIPYDIFNFTTLLNTIASQVNAYPRKLSLILGSSHLYREHVESAERVIYEGSWAGDALGTVTPPLLVGDPPSVEWLREVEAFIRLAPDDGFDLVTDYVRDKIPYPWSSFAEALVHRRFPSYVGVGFMSRLIQAMNQYHGGVS